MTHSDADLMRLIFRASALAKRGALPMGGTDDPSSKHCCSGRWHGRILSILSESDLMTQKALADRLEIRPQSLSEALTSLEEGGFIERKTNPDDKRETLVSITPIGRERSGIIEEHRKKHAQEYLSSLSEEEKELLYTILKKLTASNS